MSLLAAHLRRATLQLPQSTPLTSSPFQTQLRFATKKAGGSSRNGRDSAGRRLGVKVWGGQEAKPGSIIIRQRGQKFLAGEGVGMGRDHTIYSKVLGLVQFTDHPFKRKRRAKKRFKKVVNVVEYGEESAVEAMSAGASI
mmetsp:Transcript_3810/g.6735  ORF Transcript_3810/g.6735 Transcript_3810/m.6735 type:complete len:140 (-) Transcript_3810:63-482(-)